MIECKVDGEHGLGRHPFSVLLTLFQLPCQICHHTWENCSKAPISPGAQEPSPGVRPAFPGLLPAVGPVSLFIWAARPDRLPWGVWVLEPSRLGSWQKQPEGVCAQFSCIPFSTAFVLYAGFTKGIKTNSIWDIVAKYLTSHVLFYV